MLQKNALVAALYALVGWLALSLAIPPSFASPLYPSAGLALAAVLSWGPRVLPGVALGAAGVNLLIHLLESGFTSAPVLVCASLGIGAALQAGAAAWLVRRCCPGPLLLDEPRDVLRFFVAAGPLGCVVSAGWATATFGLGGVVAPAQLGNTLWTWWAGDTLGVLIGVPVALSFFGQPRGHWRMRRLTVALPLGVVTLVIGVAIALIARWEGDRVEHAFERDAERLNEQVRDGITRHLAALEALHGLARASDMESAQSFRLATEGWLAGLPSLRAMGWSAHVPAAGREEFEARMRQQLPGYRIFDREPGAPADAIAITHIEPHASNAAALGLNALSLAATREAIERAVRERRPAATEGFVLTQDLQAAASAGGPARYGVVVYRAVMAPPDAQGREALRGIVFVTLRLHEAFDELLPDAGGRFQACLLEDGGGAPRLLAGPAQCVLQAGVAARLYEETVRFAGREWTLRVLASPAYVAGLRSWALWSFSALGLLTTGLLGAFLLLFSGRARRIEEAVLQRTAELNEEMGRRQHAQQALADSERRFREIFDTAPVGIAYIDLHGRLRRVNPRLCEIAGRPASELEALGLPDLLPPGERLALQALLAELRSGQGARRPHRMRCCRPDGSELWVQFTGSQVDRPEAGGGASLVGIVEDITERLRLEDAERAREVAETANRAKSEFLSRMSHELRTPLNAMLGFAQLLASDGSEPLTSAQRQGVRHIEQAGWHLLELINEVLDLSRIESGSLRLSLGPVALAPLLDETLALVSGQARQRGIVLEQRFGAGAHAVSGDATRIKQVATNLLSNAIKYNRPGGRVLLETRLAADGRRVLLQVSDTGPGLSAQQQARLFQPFDRLGREHSGIEGLGIGLVISQRLAHAMGGELRCDSPPGEGATFTLALPVPGETAAARSPSGDMSAPPVRRAGGRRVLAVDGDASGVPRLRALLAQQGFEGVFACSAAEGRALLHREPPEVLLLDLDLPERQGLELLDEIRRDPRLGGLRVLALSSGLQGAAIAQALAAGVEHCLGKPLDTEVLRALLEPRITADAG
ncbi:CHASE domain-containing protein [Caldimonas tepidiphila]|uniref:CHASE domain-containing protein n=1 Tax=Caldimonas tepidiphila TaxID=2315841 RepID=UPI001475F4DE|nr:CHASE domain-containing protein [Caldimonas tepidiphila]